MIHVLAVVEDEGSVDSAHRFVDRGEGGRPLDVDIDVTGDHRLDPIGIRTQLTGAEDLDVDSDIGRLDAVADDVGAAIDLWLSVLVAVSQGEIELRLGGFGWRG